ncbi:hypothetical protein HYPSUDRAFT_70328 [Hypholoma sublateritium FD-334 SS-4]|uniref:Transmembrane protein n=1 Tax=Hypholoma sublateritium (strain FD-334 SS-4) TaxID=945553 RepID=A0A0D2PCC9_HYPSF|nr:hypothetical protein HYPSUDRAFT_70328 [Hypholoma sublateritium FD-334 SS-4]
MLKKQEGADGKIDVRLMCRSSDSKASSASKGRPQGGAMLRLKLRPPPSLKSTVSAPSLVTSTSTSTLRPGLVNAEAGPSRSSTMDSVYTDEMHVSDSAHTKEESASGVQERPASPLSEISSEKAWFGDEVPDLISSDEPPPQSTLRRRRVKGYAIYSDEDCSEDSMSDDFQETDRLLPTSQDLKDDDGNSNTIVDDDCDEDDDRSMTPHTSHLTLSLTRQKQTPDEFTFRAATGDTISFSSTTTATGRKIWIAAARDILLPLYTEKLSLPPQQTDMTFIERLLAAFTLYAQMRCAHSESDFDPIVRRLQSEWAVVGTLLLALAGVNTAMFTIQTGGMFTVSEKAQIAIALSSVTSGLGIACVAWFFMRYNWADTSTFMFRSRDVFSTDERASYFFFALSARVPAFCMFMSACALTACLALIAFATFPGGVLVLSFVVGVLMSLQFIVFGMSWLGRQVVTGGRAGGERVRGAVKRVRSMTTSTVVE